MKIKRLIILGVTILCFAVLLSPAGAADNGTVTLGSLVWLKDAGCLVGMNWMQANHRVASLAHGQ
ncbi:MAG: hypothetical protein M0009_01180 [Deltaproteobacteria bacterium]|nr:hypothetical protein [Deltaproteobacteria bacterium]